MEKRGIQTNIGNLNREIKAANSLMKSIRQLIKNLKGWIAELSEKRNELLAQKAAEEAVFLPNLLMKYINKIDTLLKQPNCPFVLFVGTRKLVKRREFEEYIRRELII